MVNVGVLPIFKTVNTVLTAICQFVISLTWLIHAPYSSFNQNSNLVHQGTTLFRKATKQLRLCLRSSSSSFCATMSFYGGMNPLWERKGSHANWSSFENHTEPTLRDYPRKWYCGSFEEQCLQKLCKEFWQWKLWFFPVNIGYVLKIN